MDSGAQAAQSCHCAFSFMEEHLDIARNWMYNSNYIAILACKNEQALLSLIDKAEKKGINFSVFFEPDFDNEITAVALEPGKMSKKLCSSFRLALKDK